MKNKKKQTTSDLIELEDSTFMNTFMKLVDKIGVEKAFQECVKMEYDKIKTFKETELSLDDNGVAHITIASSKTDVIDNTTTEESVE